MPAVSEDGLTATIKIRPGVKFHNTGNEMTADDWVWSWNRLKNLLGNPSFLVTDFIESFSAVDSTTIEIKLLSPNAALAAILTSLPFAVTDSKAAQENGGVAEEGADQRDKLTDWLNQGNSIGTGPYRLAQWDVANEIILESNADYWDDAAAFDRIIFRNVADSSTRLQLLETGEADFAFSVDPDQMQQVLDNPGLQLIEGPSLAYEYLALNVTEEVGGPLASKEARQATLTPSTIPGLSMVYSLVGLSARLLSFRSVCLERTKLKNERIKRISQRRMSSGQRVATVQRNLHSRMEPVRRPRRASVAMFWRRSSKKTSRKSRVSQSR
jgi:peptide/nickel transport system substrate-binding protein